MVLQFNQRQAFLSFLRQPSGRAREIVLAVLQFSSPVVRRLGFDGNFAGSTLLGICTHRRTSGFYHGWENFWHGLGVGPTTSRWSPTPVPPFVSLVPMDCIDVESQMYIEVDFTASQVRLNAGRSRNVVGSRPMIGAHRPSPKGFHQNVHDSQQSSAPTDIKKFIARYFGNLMRGHTEAAC